MPNKIFTENQLAVIEDYSHETTMWYCDMCGKWFEYKDDLMNHYEPKLSENIFQDDEPCFDMYCDHSAGSSTA